MVVCHASGPPFEGRKAHAEKARPVRVLDRSGLRVERVRVERENDVEGRGHGGGPSDQERMRPDHDVTQKKLEGLERVLSAVDRDGDLHAAFQIHGIGHLGASVRQAPHDGTDRRGRGELRLAGERDEVGLPGGKAHAGRGVEECDRGGKSQDLDNVVGRTEPREPEDSVRVGDGGASHVASQEHGHTPEPPAPREDGSTDRRRADEVPDEVHRLGSTPRDDSRPGRRGERRVRRDVPDRDDVRSRRHAGELVAAGSVGRRAPVLGSGQLHGHAD